MQFENIQGFDWDSGNRDKNWIKHQVSNFEAEQVFFNNPLLIFDDSKHSSNEEKRFFALGHTNQKRLLSLVFTIRNKLNLIRIISARDMSKKERLIYNEE